MFVYKSFKTQTSRVGYRGRSSERKGNDGGIFRAQIGQGNVSGEELPTCKLGVKVESLYCRPAEHTLPRI